MFTFLLYFFVYKFLDYARYQVTRARAHYYGAKWGLMDIFEWPCPWEGNQRRAQFIVKWRLPQDFDSLKPSNSAARLCTGSTSASSRRNYCSGYSEHANTHDIFSLLSRLSLSFWTRHFRIRINKEEKKRMYSFLLNILFFSCLSKWSNDDPKSFYYILQKWLNVSIPNITWIKILLFYLEVLFILPSSFSLTLKQEFLLLYGLSNAVDLLVMFVT